MSVGLSSVPLSSLIWGYWFNTSQRLSKLEYENIDITLGAEFEDLFIFNLTCKFLNLQMTKHRIQREIVTNRLKDTTRNLTYLAKRKNLKMNSDN